MNPERMKQAITGCLLGTAAGDALGLALEGLSKSRQHKMFPDVARYHFLFGKGMVSDDTQHQVMVAQALIKSGGDPDSFARDLAWRLRFWLAGLPAGVGLATLRSLLKLWFGFSAHKSGVFSAGNGPTMRAALLGVAYGDQKEKLLSHIKICTRITHTDPKAEYGSLAVALAANCCTQGEHEPDRYLSLLESFLDNPDPEFMQLMQKTVDSVKNGETTEVFAEGLGLEKGVTGYMYHTLPVVLHAWLRNPNDYKTALLDVIRCGGDADTTGAILGSIVGAGVGKDGIPKEWLDGLIEWPQSVEWMERLGGQLATVLNSGGKAAPLSTAFVLQFCRNLLFTAVVLIHGFRRMLPPY